MHGTSRRFRLPRGPAMLVADHRIGCRHRHVRSLAGITAILAVTWPVQAAIDLSLVPVQPVYTVGETVEIQLIATSDSEATQVSAAMLAVFGWDPLALQLTGVHQFGATPVLGASFPLIYAPNELALPADGDGALQVLAQLGLPMPATPDGTLITTFQFTAIAPDPDSSIDLLPSLSGVDTVVFDGVIPNFDVTGQLSGTSVTIVPAPGALGLLLGAAMASRRRRRS